jgi:group I intron endonuclease
MYGKSEMGVYRITNKVTGKHYVGSAAHMRRRWNQHRAQLRKGSHHSVKLQRSWDEHGEAAFEFVLLEVIEDEALLLACEQKWMDALDGYAGGYNACREAGRTVGRTWTDEQRKRASESKKGRVFSDEHRARISEALRGRTHSDECKAKIAAKARERAAKDPEAAGAAGRAGKGRKWSEETRAKIMAARAAGWTDAQRQAASDRGKARRHSPEAKAKISASNSRRGVSDATRQKMSEALAGRKLSPEHAEKSRQHLERLRKGSEGNGET